MGGGYKETEDLPRLDLSIRNVELFVTLVTEVSLISREPNLRFQRISLYLEYFSGNRSVLFPSALDTIAEEDSSRVI